VVDLVYQPRITSVMARAQARGLVCVDGLGMLVHQGALAFTRWTGREAPVRRDARRARSVARMSGLDAREDAGAVVFSVRVAPRASRSAVLGVHEGALKVALTAPPVDGAANAALVAFLAKALGVAKRDVVIEQGDTSRSKRLRVTGVTLAQLAALLP
jgi:uncharacterized protein (TIGR00251 family)